MAQTDYISQAKAYLRERLSAEISFQNNLEKLLDDYVSKLVDIAYASNINPDYFTFSYNKKIKQQVDALIADLLYDITDYVETLAIATHADNKDKILAYINRDIAGENFPDRAKKHTQTFKKEMEGIIAAGLLIGASKTDIKHSIKTYRKMPYQNPIFKRAYLLRKGESKVLLEGGLHFGVGVSNSAYNSIDTLGRFTIGDAWMYDGYLEMDAQGAIGYVGHRGSGYPCQICDDEANRFHSLSEGMIYPLHPNCVCYVTPVFRNDI